MYFLLLGFTSLSLQGTLLLSVNIYLQPTSVASPPEKVRQTHIQLTVYITIVKDKNYGVHSTTVKL